MNKDRLMKTLDFRNITFINGKGPHLFDDKGGKYLDFFTDVGTSSLGYGGSEHDLARTIAAVMPIHAPNLYHFGIRDLFADELCNAAGMDKVFFCNSGTESVEAAIKLARKYQSDEYHRNLRHDGIRHTIYAYEGGFHGRTYGALSAGDGPNYHYDGFEPMLPGFKRFTDIDGIKPNAIAVILAPVFGNNDVILYDDWWLKRLREFTHDNGILLIFDEVQTGAGRCGDITYAKRIGVQPDIMTLAKGIAMGCPFGAMLAKEQIAAAFTPGTHFSTFGGNPLACSYAYAMLNWLTSDNLANVNRLGDRIRLSLRGMGWPGNVRGVGMLNAFDINIDSKMYAAKCLQKGLLIGAFRAGPGPVKITPPLNIEASDLEMGLRIMDEAYKEIIS